MSGLLPMAMFGIEVPSGDIAVPAGLEIPAAFRITMAAIDPSEELAADAAPRATLKVIRQPLGYDDEDDEDDEDDDFDADEMDRILAVGSDDEDSSDDEDVRGGPSDPSKRKEAQLIAKLAKLQDEAEDLDMEDQDDEGLPNGTNGLSAKAKGKLPAGSDEEVDDDDDDDDDQEVEEFVLCTLDPSKIHQQPLDITFGEREIVYFKVSGGYSIHLTGNYVESEEDRSRFYDPEDDEDDEYDLEPDLDELDDMDEEEEEDELDDLEDPRITEIDEDEEVPALVKTVKPAKGNKKRAATEDDAAAETLDEMMTAQKTAANGVQKLSKKQLKKLKKNDGSAVVVEKEVDIPSSNKSDKKVQFAKELEQGPTPTKDDKAAGKATLGPKVVQGVTIDDKKLGKGPAAKRGDRVGMRYIGKLEKDNSVFDSNKKGKPFSFKLGGGEVIKGWDIGIAGMSIGGERRVTIPAHLAYGSKGAPPAIPANATLIFDVKLIDLNKGK